MQNIQLSSNVSIQASCIC